MKEEEIWVIKGQWVSRIGGVAYVGEAVRVMVGVRMGFWAWVGGVGVVREMDTSKEKEVVEDGQLGFETIISRDRVRWIVKNSVTDQD
jgi:hypothetical protein